MSRVVGAMNFARVSFQMLREYGDEVNRQLQDIVPDAADIAVKMIRKDSRKRTGVYARDWAKKRVRHWRFGSTYIIHNREHYRVAHLLEYPHQIENKYGTYGTTAGDSVIWFAQEYVDQWIELELIKRLEG